MKLLLATANAHKIQELTALLPGYELLTLRDFPQIELPEETGATMAANARLKAEHCAKETALPALADDSGIEVDFLEQGVRLSPVEARRSAREVRTPDFNRIEINNANPQTLSPTPTICGIRNSGS